MKEIIMPGLVAIAVLCPVSAARAGDAATTLFTCSLGKKTVSVTSADGRLTYHYGTGKKDELSIVGVPAAGNIFEMDQRFAGIEDQLRFKKGDYSYIIYSIGANDFVGAAADSGLVVMRGTKVIFDRSCAQYTELDLPDDSFDIPEDTEAYSAM
ncbi:MAG: hypothetical protein KGL10_07285 [Alphaproteobacteria bacterium]|nr:hypothetical protein [Alphaproteobacteria bacterium]MDE2337097.1 hypothetical protein [Alphaproteobacteria bacterium]